VVGLVGHVVGVGCILVWPLGSGWWVTLVALVCIWCANGFQSPWLMWVSIAVYRGVLTFGLRLKMKGCMGIVFMGRVVVGGLLFGCLVVGMGV